MESLKAISGGWEALVATCYSSQGSETRGMPLEEMEAKRSASPGTSKQLQTLEHIFLSLETALYKSQGLSGLTWEQCLSAMGKKSSTQALLTVLRAESPPPSCRAGTALQLNAKPLSPSQTLGSSSKNASVTQCLHRIHLWYENPGKNLINPGESEGTSSSFRHTAGEYLSQKILQGTLLSFRHALPASQKLRRVHLKSLSLFSLALEWVHKLFEQLDTKKQK